MAIEHGNFLDRDISRCDSVKIVSNAINYLQLCIINERDILALAVHI